MTCDHSEPGRRIDHGKPSGSIDWTIFSRPCPHEKISRIFRRFPGPACILFGLLALLYFLPASPVRAADAITKSTGATLNSLPPQIPPPPVTGPTPTPIQIPPPPIITSRGPTGSIPPPGKLTRGTNCPPPGQASCGDPISLPTGNVYYNVTDYKTAEQNPLAVTRHYNSTSGDGPSAFGSNWSWTYDRSLSINAVKIDAYRPDGKAISFSANGNGGWSGVSDLDVQLTESGSTWTLTDQDDNVETYTTVGSLGLLTSIRSRNGYTQTLQYNANSQLVLVTDTYGRTLAIAHNGNGLVGSITTPDGLVLSYTYNSNNLLVQVGYSTSPATSQTYLYEDAKFVIALTGIIDEDGKRFATWTYDDTYIAPRATSSQLAGRADLTTVAYNADGSVTETNALGLQQVYKFGSFQASINGSEQYIPVCTEIDRLASATTAAAVRTFTYDSNGYLASSTDWDGNVTTYTNDARGNQLSKIVGYGTAQALTITTSWLPNFHLPTQISEGNRTISFTYDANGELLTRTVTTSPGAAPGVGGDAVTKTLTSQGTWLYSNKAAGQGLGAPPSGTTSTWTYTYSNLLMTSATDPDEHATSYSYDASGALVSIANALGQTTQITQHLPGGLPQRMVDPNGLVTTLSYDARDRLLSKTVGQWVTSYSYDAAGNLITLTRPDGSALAYSYDQAHRLIQITDLLNNRMVYTLNAAGDVTKEQVLDAFNNPIWTRSYTYDAVNRLIQTIGALGQTTNFSYDSNNNFLQFTDPLGNVTSKSYDALNRVIRSTDPNGGLTAYGYDPESRLNSVTDPRGLMTSYVYDGLNDMTSIGSPDTGVTAKTYDAAGNLVSSTDARSDTTTYSYDALNRVTQAAFADGTSITYQYDQGTYGIGHLTSMSDAGGTTAWVYNVNGLVTSKQQTSGGVTLTTSHAYNAVTGQLASTTYPSGTTISYSYDADGRVNGMSYQPQGGSTSSLLSQIAYQPFGPAASWSPGGSGSYTRTYDQDDRVVGLAMSSTGLTIALAYDADDRMTSIAESGLPQKTFGYDALGRVINYTSGTTTQTYAYDADGNRTGFTAPNVALAYQYATASNRLLGISGSETDSFTYDANGNMLSHTSPFADYTYTYNARNRRTQAYVGAVATTDAINGLGQRTVQTQVTTQYFAYDEAGHLIGSYNGQGAVIAETVWLGDLPVALLSPGGTFYIAPDQLGAPHQIANAGGAVEWLWDHDPFGNGTPSGSLSDNLRFPGQVYDQNAKLHYNVFRDYDPNTGRYIESDPSGLVGGVNTYAYVGGNPISQWDPLGLHQYTEAETRALLQQVYNDSTAGPIQGWFNILHNSGANGKYDLGTNSATVNNTYTINGRNMNSHQMGNYIAGYSGAAYDSVYGGGVVNTTSSVIAAGVIFHLTGHTDAVGDPWDMTGRPDIEAGIADVYYNLSGIQTWRTPEAVNPNDSPVLQNGNPNPLFHDYLTPEPTPQPPQSCSPMTTDNFSSP